MNEQKFKGMPNEIIHINQLINEGNHEEALQLMKDFMKKGNRSLHERLILQLLKIELLFEEGLDEEAIKLAAQFSS